jgi:predicted Holliday junction resolvase-like endonuclease
MMDIEKHKQYMRNYQRQNSKKLNDYMKIWRKNNPEKDREIKKRYYQKNREKILQREKKYRDANKEKIKEILKRWYQKNKDAVSQKRLQLKVKVLIHYSGNPPKCACCGETIIEFLTIDHIKGGGNKHKKSLNLSMGYSFYYWLVKNGYPEGYQVLCMNCNWGKRNSGVCPHALHSK